MKPKQHWEKVYAGKATDEVSWFQKHATLSLKLIETSQLDRAGKIIDVGGGASILVDDLLAHGFEHITVLDLSGLALAAAKKRLGTKADAVTWIEGNILEARLSENYYDVWHDRAVFHFLITAAERQAYVRTVRTTVKPGGLVIVATFAEDGPQECSGLPVMRYSAEGLHAEFGEAFVLLDSAQESHHTPAGKQQHFVYCLLRKLA